MRRLSRFIGMLMAAVILASGCASRRAPLVLMSHNPDGAGVQIWRLKLLDDGSVVEEKLDFFKPLPDGEVIREVRRVPKSEIPIVVGEVLEELRGLPEQTFDRIMIHPESKLLRVSFDGAEHQSRRQVVDSNARNDVELQFDHAWEVVRSILLGPDA
jgi:hypothetical protein